MKYSIMILALLAFGNEMAVAMTRDQAANIAIWTGCGKGAFVFVAVYIIYNLISKIK